MNDLLTYELNKIKGKLVHTCINLSLNFLKNVPTSDTKHQKKVKCMFTFEASRIGWMECLKRMLACKRKIK